MLAIEEELRGGLFPGSPDLPGRVDLIIETPEELCGSSAASPISSQVC